MIVLPFFEKEEYIEIYKSIGWIIVSSFSLVILLELISLILIKKKDKKKKEKKKEE